MRHQPFTVLDFCSQREITQWQRPMKAGAFADEALGRLIQGNQRFLRGEARNSAFRRETLIDLVKAQRP